MSGKKKSDWEQPSLTLLIKVGSAVVHAQEFISAGGHVFDLQAFHAMVSDPEV